MWIGDLKRSEIFNASFLDGISLSGLWGGAHRPGAPTRMFKPSPQEELSIVLVESDEPAFAWVDVRPSIQPAMLWGHQEIPIPPGMVAGAVWQLVQLVISGLAKPAEMRIEQLRVVLADRNKKVLKVLSPADVQAILESVGRQAGSLSTSKEHREAEAVEHSH
jgi:hypothetical protein